MKAREKIISAIGLPTFPDARLGLEMGGRERGLRSCPRECRYADLSLVLKSKAQPMMKRTPPMGVIAPSQRMFVRARV